MASGRTRVAVEGVSKKFARSLKKSFVYGAEEIVRAAIGRPPNQQLRDSEFWALRDVSFTLKEGQSIGIVGLNGSGKTTLLRIISGILRSTRGQVRVDGVIAPMLALGAGFKPVLSGRENVFLNMSLLGLAPEIIRRRFDAVLDFADIGAAIDAPLGTYSTGMRMRLGFACAIFTEPEILIVDEVLSVGDARFRVKCRNKMNEQRRNGMSMLLVSHSSISIEALCDECVYLKKGRVASIGPPKEVLAAYQADMIQQAATANEKAVNATLVPEVSQSTSGDSELVVESIQLYDANGVATPSLKAAEDADIEVALCATGPIDDVSINVILVDQSHNLNETVQYIALRRDAGAIRLAEGVTRVRLGFQPLVLRPGTYRLKLSVSKGSWDDLLAVVDRFKLIVTDASGDLRGHMFQPRRWTVDGIPLQPLSLGRPIDELEETDF